MEIVTCQLPELPQDVLIDIFSRLETPDCVRAGSVHPSWRSAYTSLLSLVKYKQSKTPCLFYTSEYAGGNAVCLYSLMEKRVYKLTRTETLLCSRYLIGSSQGLLVTVDERSEMQLVHPITCEQIDLPSVTTIEQVKPIYDDSGAVHMYEYSLHTAQKVFCPPEIVALDELRKFFQHKAFVLSDTSTKSLIVVLIHNPHRQLSFARIGDVSWTWLPPHAFFDDCTYKDGLLYAVNTDGEIHAFDLTGPKVTCKMILGKSEVVKCSSMYIVQAPWGDLLQIWRSFTDYELEPQPGAFEYWNTGRIRIYKVDSAGKRREKVKCLGDHVLFLGHNKSLCLSAKECPGLKANHVYFTDDSFLWKKGFKNNRRDIGILNLFDNSREEIVSPQLWSDYPAPTWITLDLRKMKVVLNQL
ncbi:probable F-box protein At4g22165 [Lolium rigidum]|uniref:probable F-box protein At4g22165 n=1 Tax=Lolium rigidum TaxID=89674 RepID=UPI001F5C94F5|nr:probable F-box protein At4g22165 [Lolium rigidum]